jgi:DNA polymerase V
MKVLQLYVHAGITGFPSPAAEYKELGLSLDELLITHASATFLGQAVGHSMMGVGIFDGDLLICDRAVPFENLDVCIINFNGEFMCKIVDKARGMLLSASDGHKPIKISEDDVFQLEGVITCSIRLHRKVRDLLQ